MADKKNNYIDPNSVISDHFKYVRQYRNASAALENSKDTLFPNQQVRGLLIELALKTYICSMSKISWGHDLEKLAKEAESLGLVLLEKDLENIIIPVNELYFKHGICEADFLCRYPMPNRGILITLTPTHKMVDDMVARIIEQSSVNCSSFRSPD